MIEAQKIQLVEDMVREDPDYTIKDYLKIVEEIEAIEKTIIVKKGKVEERKVYAYKSDNTYLNAK